MLGKLPAGFEQDRKRLLETVGAASRKAIEGYDPDALFSRVIFSGGHDASAIAVQNGKVDAAAIADAMLEIGFSRGMLKADEIEVIWISDPIPGAPVVYRRDLPESLKASIRACESQGLVLSDERARLRLTPKGFLAAEKITYDHRLWELYLTQYADIAPSQVDRGADAIEHVLDAEMIRELESLLRQRGQDKRIPPSLHPTVAAPSAG